MFCGILYVILMLLDTIISETSREPFYADGLRHQDKFSDILDSSIQNGDRPKLRFHDCSRSQSRRKREIVLIDEDFDKLPEKLVRQGWDDTKPEPETTESKIESDKYLTTEEGSGSTFVKDDSTTEYINTPGKLQVSKDQGDITAKQTSTIKHFNILDTTVKYISTAGGQFSSDIYTTTTDSTIEGSGDDMEFPTTTTRQEEVTDFIDDSKLMLCLNYSCEAQDIEISPGFMESMPEDTTLILSCSMGNRSKSDILQWYKTNGSDNTLLVTSLTGNLTQFTVPKTKTQDSGVYVCLRWSKHQCCHKQLDVTIYKKPNYKFHLLIVGLVAAVSLFTCLLLSIHRNYKIKQFKKQLNTQIPLNDYLL